MLRPIDRTHRDCPLYPGSAKTLRDFIDPKHLLVRIDANFDFAVLAEFLGERYNPNLGRPAVHPEVLVRALVLSAVYNVTSYRGLSERIAENLAWRWFCHLALEDEVFDHSTITVFIERIGQAAFQELLARLNDELGRLGLLSSRTYADSSLVEADARTRDLSPTSLSPKEFRQRASRQEGGFVLPEKHPPGPEDASVGSLIFSRYQDPSGRLPLSPTDPDARWRKIGARPAILGYKENLVVDRSGFIVARGLTPANASDPDGLEPLLGSLPIQAKSLAADTGYRSLRLRFLLRRQGVAAYIPLHPKDEAEADQVPLSEAFAFHGDHLTCRAGAELGIGGLPDSKDVIQFVAKETDCRACSAKADCLSAKEKRKHVAMSRFHFEIGHARRTNQTSRYAKEMNRRKTIVEGVFARLDRLGWDRARLRTIGKADIQGSIAALAHNILKALTKRRFFWAIAARCPIPALPPYPTAPSLIFHLIH